MKNLDAVEVLANVDKYNIAILAESMDNYIIATKALREEGQTYEYTNKFGATNRVTNPRVNIQLKYSGEAHKLSNAIGLTPAARLKIIQDHLESGGDEFDSDFD